MNLQGQLAAAEAAIEEVREQQRLEVEMVGVERDAALLELRVQQVTELNASEELVAEAEREAEEGRAEVGRLEGEQVRCECGSEGYAWRRKGSPLYKAGWFIELEQTKHHAYGP